MRTLFVCHNMGLREALEHFAEDQDLVVGPGYNVCGMGFTAVVFVDAPGRVSRTYEDWVLNMRTRLLPGGVVVNDPTEID